MTAIVISIIVGLTYGFFLYQKDLKKKKKEDLLAFLRQKDSEIEETQEIIAEYERRKDIMLLSNPSGIEKVNEILKPIGKARSLLVELREQRDKARINLDSFS